MISGEFKKKIQLQIQKNLQALKKLHEAGDRLKKEGRLEDYYDLTAPDNTGDLYYLIDDPKNAKLIWSKAIDWIEKYNNRLKEQGEKPENSPYSAAYYWRAGDLETALAIFLKHISSEDELSGSMFAIALRNCGENNLYRKYLNMRLKRFDKGDENSMVRWHHLSEVLFWLDDYRKALEYSNKVLDQKKEKKPVSLLAFNAFLKYKIGQTTKEKRIAVEKLEKAIEDFFDEGDVRHAMDAKEYQNFVVKMSPEKSIPVGAIIQGTSFLMPY